MKPVFKLLFAIIISLQFPLTCEITDWQKNQLQSELEGMDQKIPHQREIRAAYLSIKDIVTKGCNSLRIYHVEIQEDQSIYIDGQNIEQLSHELSLLIRKLREWMPLPSCSFLYTRNGENLVKHNVLSHLKTIPILVGTKHLPTKAKQILFIEECSTVDRKSTYYSWWDASQVYRQVRQFRDQYLWSQKIPKLIWRGYLSDEMHSKNTSFQGKCYLLSPRMILHALTNVYPNLIDAKLTNLNVPTARQLNQLDISSLFFPDKKNFNKIGVNGTIELNPRVNIESQLKYRYQIALDGIQAANPGYAWRLLSGCLVFKQESPYIQWFYAGLTPWVHYIPVKNFLEDLMPQLQWAVDHDADAEQIGRNSKEFAENYLDLDKFMEQAHFVIEEYAKLQKQAI